LPLDPNSLPKDSATLKKIVVDLAEQLDRTAGERDRESSEKNKYAEMIRELLEAQRARKSEKLSAEQATVFEELWQKLSPADPRTCDVRVEFEQ
jgi:peptidoglycan hydrolase CwlO-like protein